MGLWGLRLLFYHLIELELNAGYPQRMKDIKHKGNDGIDPVTGNIFDPTDKAIYPPEVN